MSNQHDRKIGLLFLKVQRMLSPTPPLSISQSEAPASYRYYHAVGNAIREKASKLHPVPLKALVEFDRVVDLAPQASQKVAFALDVEQALSVTTADGSKVVYPGEHQLIFSTGVPGVPDVVQTVTV